MKIKKIIFFLIAGLLIFGSVNNYAETIYTKDGKTVNAKVVSRGKNIIWYEVRMSSGSGKMGMDINSVSEILNDDGTISPYSPTFVEPEQLVWTEEPFEAEEIAEEPYQEELLTDEKIEEPEQPAWVEKIPEAAERIPEAAEFIKEAARKIKVKDGQIQISFPATAGSVFAPGQLVGPEELKAAIKKQMGIDDKLYPKLKGLFFAILPILLILTLAVYVYFSICLQIIARKTDTANGWLAWIPFVNLFLMANISKKPRSWFYILGGLLLLNFIPFIGIIGALGLSVITVILWCNIAKVRNKPSWYGILMSLPIVQLIVLTKLTFSD